MLIFWTLFGLGLIISKKFGLGLNFDNSGLDLDCKIWQSTHLWLTLLWWVARLAFFRPNSRNLGFFEMVWHAKMMFGMYVTVWEFFSLFWWCWYEKTLFDIFKNLTLAQVLLSACNFRTSFVSGQKPIFYHGSIRQDTSSFSLYVTSQGKRDIILIWAQCCQLAYFMPNFLNLAVFRDGWHKYFWFGIFVKFDKFWHIFQQPNFLTYAKYWPNFFTHFQHFCHWKHTWNSSLNSLCVVFRGVQSLKFLTPTPLLLRLNILRLKHILKFWTPTPAQTPKWII